MEIGLFFGKQQAKKMFTRTKKRLPATNRSDTGFPCVYPEKEKARTRFRVRALHVPRCLEKTELSPRKIRFERLMLGCRENEPLFIAVVNLLNHFN
jgi:hypothetical protein